MILREIKNMYIKNRLTEGVDFKRYEWLKGDSTNKAYIDTTIYDLDSIHTIDIIFKPVLPIESVFGRQKTASERFCIQYQISTNALVVYTINYYELKPVSTDGEIVHIIFDLDNSLVTDGTKTVTISGFKNQNTTLSLNLFNIRNSNQYYNGRIKSFIIDNKINLVPCQLIKSIPSFLDANNIARSAGECGMYDSISGKFYGNVANSGTFTVIGDVEPETHTGLQQIYQNKLIEGVDYETYDWLKGDGAAYIDTNVPLKNISNYSVIVYITRRDITQGIFGARISATDDVNLEVIYDITPKTNFRMDFGNYKQTGKYYALRSSHQYEIKWYNGVLSVNDENIATIQYTTLSELTARLFFTSQNFYPRIFEGKIASLVISNVINLTPCQLLKSIPRNLDAQCKERVAGECGMIDLISGKFYGNVANSGTFTVENDNN